MHQHGFTRLQPGVIEQHMLHGRECDRRAGGIASADAVRNGDHQSLRQVQQFTGETIDVKAHDAGDVFAQIVAALLTGPANPAGEGAVHHDLLSRREAGDAFTDRGNFA